MYSRDNYQKVKLIIEERRNKAIRLADARDAEVRAMSEDIRLIDRELTKTGLMLFKAACDGEDIAPIRENNQRLVKRREEALEKLRMGMYVDARESSITKNIEPSFNIPFINIFIRKTCHQIIILLGYNR